MLRLIKILNSNNQFETVRLEYNYGANLGPGSALSCTIDGFNSAANTSMPEYVALSVSDIHSSKMDAILVTEDMVFKVEYLGSETPYIGMSVGLATHKYKMDAVTYNSSGKGTIIGVDDSKKLVYVRFHR